MFATMSMLTVASLAFAEPAETSPAFQVFSYDSETWYAAQCTEQTISHTPRWDEKAESPPISPRKAIRLATKMKDSFFKDGHSFKFMSLTLRPVGERWVWVVEFMGRPQKPKEPKELKKNADGFYVAEPIPSASLLVLMDGTVPKPAETEPGGYYGVAPQPDDEASSDPKKSPDSK